MREWIKAIIVLPFNVIVIIPSLILYFSKFKYELTDIAGILGQDKVEKFFKILSLSGNLFLYT